MSVSEFRLKYRFKDANLTRVLEDIKKSMNNIIVDLNAISDTDIYASVGYGGTADYLSSEHFKRTSGKHIEVKFNAIQHGMLQGLNDDDHKIYLLHDGTRELSGNWDAGSFYIQATRFISDIAIGTSPLTVTSTTVCSNLNADQVDGCDSIDEDNMVSDSDVHIPTQQSVKAYVDSAAGGASLYAFKTITGITNDVVADATDDTLTLASANNKLTIVGTAATDTITFTLDETNIDHDNLTNFLATEHFLQTAITNVSTALSTGLLKVTTGTGALSIITDSSANWDTAYGWGDHASGGYAISGGAEHDGFSDFVANEHIDHSGVSISSGTGLTGGGDITATRTLSLSWLGIESLADPNADNLMGWDDTDGAIKFITVGTNLSYDHATHTLSATSGAPTDASYLVLGYDGDLSAERLLTGGNGISLVDAGADGTLTINWAWLGIEGLSDAGADRIMFWDDSATSCDWLACGNSVAITTTTLDTIQDIQTTASPTFSGLTLETINLADGTDTHIIKAVQETGLGGRYTVGLDETARTMVICDAAGVDVDLGLVAQNFPTVYLMDTDRDSWFLVGWDSDDLPKLQAGGSASKIGIYSDFFTDRWLEQDGNTFVGVNVASAGNLAHGVGLEGYYNSAFGFGALKENTTGQQNSAFGGVALQENTTGKQSSAFGFGALELNTAGHYNSAFGYASLYPNTTGSYDVGIGYNAGRYQNDGTTPLQTPENSCYFGVNTKSGSDPAGGEDVIDNEIVIGYNAIGHGSHSVTLGNTDIVTTVLRGNVGIDVSTFGAGAVNVFAIPNGTPPAAAVADEIQIYSKDSSDGAANATLALMLEQTVEAGAPTPSHKIKVWINGTEYWLCLDAV